MRCSLCAWVVACTFLASGICASDQEPVAWLRCTLSPLPENQAAQLHVMLVGDKVVRAVVMPFGLAGTDVSGLRVEGAKLTGTLIVGHDELKMNRTLVPRLATRMPLTLDLVLNDGTVTGSFKGHWPKPKTTDTPIPVEGKASGTIEREPDLRKRFALPGDTSWPSWLGPNQNFSSGPVSAPLIDDLNNARLVWVSQWIGPTESGSHRYGACIGAPSAAGGASPLVWNGRVYQFRYEAAGAETQQAHIDVVMGGEKAEENRRKMEAIGWTDADLRKRWSIRADEQLVCIDAATGRTLWKTDWPGEGIHLFDHKCSLTNHTGVISNGFVFVFGSMGIVRCVDAKTGKERWSAKVPGYNDTMSDLLEKSLQQKITRAPTRSFCHALNVSGDVVLAPDRIDSSGLVALDTATGQVRWHIKESVLGNCVTPMAWRHGQTDYVIAANEAGAITCIVAATGKIAWRYTEAGDNEYQPLLIGDFLIGHKMKRDEREKASRTPDDGPHSAPGDNYGQVACWRLTPDGPIEQWVAPAEWGAPSNCPIGSTAGGLICFRGNYSYHLVDPKTGKRVASCHLTEPVRWDEGHMLALPDRFVLHPDSQHGHTKMFLLPARVDGQVSAIWSPPHPWATTYQSAMSHAWADGRLFIRGADALYCYELRRGP